MAVISMTGFGRGEAAAGKVSAVVEAASVNRRQLDVQFSLPRSLAVLEPRLLEMVRRHCTRGRVNVVGRVEWKRGAQAVAFNEPAAAEWVHALRAAARRLKLEDDLRASVLLQMPPDRSGEGPAAEEAEPVLMRALEKALRRMVALRRREGRALAADFRKQLQPLKAITGAIRAAAPQAVQRYRAALLGRLQESGLELALDDPRLLKELALFADRADISEELTRLESHFDQFRMLMEGDEPAGRALDFLAQELFREINTIASKANALEITRGTVAFKTELERLREQIQNVE